jgi:hypothetical protein
VTPDSDWEEVDVTADRRVVEDEETRIMRIVHFP